MNREVQISDEELLYEAPRDREGRNVLRVTRAKANGYPFIGIREWYRADDGELRPGKKGITIRMRELPAVLDALTKAAG